MKIKLLVLCCITFLLCGCWNYNELNQIAIVTALGIDKDKKENTYQISATISNAHGTQSNTKEGQSQTVIIEGKGHTISEALNDIDLQSPKEIYLGSLNVIIFSEDVAKEGVNKIADFLMREPESRKKFYLLVTQDEKASDVLQILSPLEALPSQNIASNILEATNYQAVVADINYSDFIRTLIEPGKQPVLSSIKITGDKKDGSKYSSLEQSKPAGAIKLSNLAIFKKDKLLGFANKKESQGINLIANEAKRITIETKCDNDYMVAELNHPHNTITVSLQNNKPVVKMSLTSKGNITEMGCNLDLRDPKTIDTITKKFEKDTADILKAGIHMAQKKYKSDIFGIGRKFQKKYPSYFHKHQNNWDDEIFSKLKIQVHVDLDLETKGSLEQSIRKEES